MSKLSISAPQKPKIVISIQNKKWTETDSKDDEKDNNDVEEMLEETAKTYDTSVTDVRYSSIRTDINNDIIQIHNTDGEMPQGKNSENSHRIDAEVYRISHKFSGLTS